MFCIEMIIVLSLHTLECKPACTKLGKPIINKYKGPNRFDCFVCPNS